MISPDSLPRADYAWAVLFFGYGGPMGKSYEEKREFRRITGEFRVEYREVIEALFQHLLETGDFEDNPASELEEEARFIGATTDVSQAGLGLSGDLKLQGGRELKIGKRLYMELHLNDLPRPVRALCTVVWTVPGAKPEAGIMFMGISERDLKRVHTFVETAEKNFKGD